VKAFASVGVHFTGLTGAVNRDSDSTTASVGHGPGGSDEATKTWVDASISLTPTITDAAGGSQLMTCEIQQDTGDGNGLASAPDGTECDWTIPSGPHSGGSQDSSCTTAGGTCTFTVDDGDSALGTDAIHATTTFLVGGVSLTRSTDASVTWQ